ncbi:MAG: hypothetical protein LBD11_06915 [Candidatus Peribacteria bacterium]|nr:hypothetical protein [Candidatus Peribacteria bacterium]
MAKKRKSRVLTPEELKEIDDLRLTLASIETSRKIEVEMINQKFSKKRQKAEERLQELRDLCPHHRRTYGPGHDWDCPVCGAFRRDLI